MNRLAKPDLLLGLFVVVFASFVVLVWVPLDVDTGIFETVRRRTEIGDSLAPTLACFILGCGGLLLMIESRSRPGATALGLQNWGFITALLLLFFATMIIMRWAGPIAVSLFEPLGGADYRPLRDTMPWKYVGFIAGGSVLVATIISVIEHRLTWRAITVGIVSTLVLIAIYDLPFDDLVLPPNGDL